jgi:hypothetical protein
MPLRVRFSGDARAVSGDLKRDVFASGLFAGVRIRIDAKCAYLKTLEDGAVVVDGA